MAKKNQAEETAKLLAATGGAESQGAGIDGGEVGGTGTGAPPATVVAESGAVSAPVISSQLTGIEPAFVTAADGSWSPDVNGTFAVTGQATTMELRADSLRVIGSNGTVLREIGSDETGVAAAPAVVQRQILARVLVDSRFGKVNDVVRVTEDELQAAAGELCAHPASVAYAKSL